VRNDCRSAMNLCDHPEIDSESELHSGSFAQTEVGRFDENTIRAQVSGTT
jgi:hypothetical protein